MESNVIPQDEVLKASALLYLQEALAKQEFEACAQLVAAVRELGARQGEIDEVIAGYLRGDKAGGAAGAAKQPVNRLRALKEEQ